MIHVEQAIRRLRAAFPTFACGPDTVAIYAEKLAHISPEAVLRAADGCIENCERFPTVSQILERCRVPEYLTPFKALPDWRNTEGDAGEEGGPLRYGHLAGQRWERWEILNKHGVRGFPNALYYRAKRAAQESIDGLVMANIDKNRQSEAVMQGGSA